MDVFVAQSYDAVTIAAEAIGKAGTTPDKRQAIQNAIRGAKHEGVVGYIEFDQTGHNLRKIYLARLSGGKWKVLE